MRAAELLTVLWLMWGTSVSFTLKQNDTELTWPCSNEFLPQIMLYMYLKQQQTVVGFR